MRFIIDYIITIVKSYFKEFLFKYKKNKIDVEIVKLKQEVKDEVSAANDDYSEFSDLYERYSKEAELRSGSQVLRKNSEVSEKSFGQPE